MSNTENNKRIAKNTGLLYIRTLLTMFVSLYTSRIVLRELGVEDFGIYNVVGGVVVMFSFLNSAMSSATQRYLSYALGQKDFIELRKIFSLTVNIHFLIALLITFLAETIGLWFLNTKLNIPVEKMIEANWVYQFSILNFFLLVISVPYNAAIISHERMSVYAYVSIFEVLAKLGVVFALVLTADSKLIWYAGMLASIAVAVRLFYGFYCKWNFEECTYRWFWDSSKSKELLVYAGWNLFGNLAGVGFTQGINMVLNLFFGPVLNAANGIANQVNAAITAFVGNFQMAINPQIIKSYAAGDKTYMQRLVFQGSRFSFYLLLVLMMPVLFQTEVLLHWWLKQLPEYTVLFTQLILVNALINSLSGTLMTLAQATGRIKRYQAIVGSMLLLNVPISYLLLSLGYLPQTVMFVMIAISVAATLARLIILQQLGVLTLLGFLQKVVFRVVLVSLVSAVLCHFLLPFIQLPEILNFFLSSLVIEVIILGLIWSLGLSAYERQFLTEKAIIIKRRIFA